MSFFLIYFEKKNPNASWLEFQKRQESIVDTFAKVNDANSLLALESVKVLLDGKMVDSFIIHDGISSDRILQTNFKSDPIISKQKFVILNFLESRLAVNAFEHYFIFHLYHKPIYEVEEIHYDGAMDASLWDLKDFANAVKKNVLYKLVG